MIPDGYAILGHDALLSYVAGIPAAAARLGGTPDRWQARDLSDGNMNQVTALTGPAGSVVVKQALPYIRSIGEAWPFTLERIRFEHEALRLYAEIVPRRCPGIIHYDPVRALVIMEHLGSHVVLRGALLEGRVFPRLATDLGAFLARTLFATSDLHLSTGEKRALMARFDGNEELCATTEDVIFTGPYVEAPLNRWTRPQLDTAVEAIRADDQARLAAAELKLHLRSSTQALIHGDLHTGSIMVADDDTRVIDPEWARFGPIGFDLGAIVGNLLLAYFGLAGRDLPCGAQARRWILETTAGLWAIFAREFAALWRAGDSDLLPAEWRGSALAGKFLERLMASILADTLGFAGAKMIRRLIGISHVEDMEGIADPARRAACEGRALAFARAMMVGRHAWPTIESALDTLEQSKREPRDV